MTFQSQERKRLFKTYNFLYSRPKFDGINSIECFYCGDSATQLDHCPPLNWVESKTIKQWKEQHINFFLVSCCSQCNRKMSDKPLFTLLEKLIFAVKYLENLYEKKANLWSEEEIAEMSIPFQKTIRARKKLSQLLLDRVQFAQHRLAKFQYIEED